MNNPFFREIEDAKTILLIGAGGGFDVFTGLPLYRWLRDRGKTVQLANVSSGALAFCDAKTPTPGVWHITPETKANAYFPEIYLARWLADQGGETPVYAIEPAGARTIASAFSWLADQTQPDAIVLVDGGTDSLMRGDEAGLGTPEADMASLYAANLLHQVLRKFVVCLGFGIDTRHGVCHAHFLENVAALIGDDAYLGTWSLTRDMPSSSFIAKPANMCSRAFPASRALLTPALSQR